MISQLKWWNKVDSISRSVNTASCGGKSWRKRQLSWRSKCWCYNKIQRRYIFDLATFLMSNLFEIVSTVFSFFMHGANIAPTVFFKYQKCSVSLWVQLWFYIDATQVWKHIKVTTEHLEPLSQAEIWLKFQSWRGNFWPNNSGEMELILKTWNNKLQYFHLRLILWRL